MSDHNIEMVLKPKEKDLGDGFIVKRTLPAPKKRMVGPFVFWDHLGPVELKGERNMFVRAHPHIGLSTVTFLFSGEILHRDSLGNEQPIRPGEVNWMTAGSGIVHSERAENSTLEAIQLWVALPEEKEDINPSFTHVKEPELPKFQINEIDMQLIVGSAHAKQSPVPVHSELFYLRGESKKESIYTQDLNDSHEGAVYITHGEIEVNGQGHSAGTMVVYSQSSTIEFTSKPGAKFMILGGKVFPSTPTVWWNLVSHSKEKIEKAKADWKNGAFSKIPNETEFIPLPEDK